jgi:threonine dehydrogenase-like Zn-dependent dehydrogenase
VFCLHPHQSHYVVPADAVHVLPQGVPPGRAVLAAQLETAVNALWDAPVRVGDRVAVVGAGCIGLLVAWLAARVPGCAVQVVDTQPARHAIAEHLGASFSTPEAARHDADLVIHCSGQSAGLATALRLAAFEATVLELSWYGTRAVAAPLGEGFHARRLTLKSSQVGEVAAAQRSRWTHRRRLQLALTLLCDPVLDALITDTTALRDLPALLAQQAASSGDAALGHRIDYPD